MNNCFANTAYAAAAGAAIVSARAICCCIATLQLLIKCFKYDISIV